MGKDTTRKDAAWKRLTGGKQKHLGVIYEPLELLAKLELSFVSSKYRSQGLLPKMSASGLCVISCSRCGSELSASNPSSSILAHHNSTQGALCKKIATAAAASSASADAALGTAAAGPSAGPSTEPVEDWDEEWGPAATGQLKITRPPPIRTLTCTY
jgi:hypothetical protein